MSMEHWWDDTDRETNLSTWGALFYHKSYMDWFWIESTPV